MFFPLAIFSLFFSLCFFRSLFSFSARYFFSLFSALRSLFSCYFPPSARYFPPSYFPPSARYFLAIFRPPLAIFSLFSALRSLFSCYFPPSARYFLAIFRPPLAIFSLFSALRSLFFSLFSALRSLFSRYFPPSARYFLAIFHPPLAIFLAIFQVFFSILLLRLLILSKRTPANTGHTTVTKAWVGGNLIASHVGLRPSQHQLVWLVFQNNAQIEFKQCYLKNVQTNVKHEHHLLFFFSSFCVCFRKAAIIVFSPD